MFFFQAEDGIRDYKVTGVQTCALPILGRSLATRSRRSSGVFPTRSSVRCPSARESDTLSHSARDLPIESGTWADLLEAGCIQTWAQTMTNVTYENSEKCETDWRLDYKRA